MKNDLIAQAKATQTAEELIAFAKANGIEITEEDTKRCLAQLSENGAISDDDLDAVAGGISLIDDLKKVWKYKDIIIDYLFKF